jgi:serine/threonine-protein kinase HipA
VQDSAEERPAQWFFDNLLPEGGIRQALAAYARISERDSFELLSRFGEESAGALTLLPPEQPFPQEGRYLPLPTERLRALIAEMPQVPLIAVDGQAKMSLPGAQHKMGVRFGDGAFSLPQAAASSHILKPDNARVQDYPFCPANEHFCMQLARDVGLPVPQTWLVHLPEPVYVVARYDRYLDGTKVRRLHQIDLCQLLNKWPGYKYEAQGGASFAEAYAALEQLRQPAVARERALRWLVFNYLIGNSDAHAKNLAFLVSAQGIELAPFYDLLCAKAYGDDTLAMTIGGEVRYGWVTAQAWDAQAKSLGLRPAFLNRMRVSMARALPEIARRLARQDAFTEPERAFLSKVVAVIEQHAGWVLEAD